MLKPHKLSPENDVVLPPTLHFLRHAPSQPPPCMVTHAAAAASSWLRRRRIRYLLLALCSPLLLLVLCAALPFLCAAELFLRRKLRRSADRLRRCEEGLAEEEREPQGKGLLHRYLEDQLFLVGSMYDCGDDEEQQEPEEDSRMLEEDLERLGSISNRIPLLR
ncbi:hypothetical protein VNO78_12625 [Psophocarpus tetragonolobus]|uniref:Uncharacterized protein n=1 Tax=Psophocarpus tetragonolobus TaxID=3891 RepID=A0AAN9SR95_PSOTE